MRTLIALACIIAVVASQELLMNSLIQQRQLQRDKGEFFSYLTTDRPYFNQPYSEDDLEELEESDSNGLEELEYHSPSVIRRNFHNIMTPDVAEIEEIDDDDFDVLERLYRRRKKKKKPPPKKKNPFFEWKAPEGQVDPRTDMGLAMMSKFLTECAHGGLIQGETVVFLESIQQDKFLSSQISCDNGTQNFIEPKAITPYNGWRMYWKNPEKGHDLNDMQNKATVLFQSVRTTRFLGSDSEFGGFVSMKEWEDDQMENMFKTGFQIFFKEKSPSVGMNIALKGLVGEGKDKWYGSNHPKGEGVSWVRAKPESNGFRQGWRLIWHNQCF